MQALKAYKFKLIFSHRPESGREGLNANIKPNPLSANLTNCSKTLRKFVGNSQRFA